MAAAATRAGVPAGLALASRHCAATGTHRNRESTAWQAGRPGLPAGPHLLHMHEAVRLGDGRWCDEHHCRHTDLLQALRNGADVGAELVQRHVLAGTARGWGRLRLRGGKVGRRSLATQMMAPWQLAAVWPGGAPMRKQQQAHLYTTGL